MKSPIFKLKGKVWLHSGMAGAWHFVTLPKKTSKEIKEGYPFIGKHGFGSIPVIVTVGEINWKTSIFPDSKLGAYVLPLKASVRKEENIVRDKMLSYSIKLVM